MGTESIDVTEVFIRLQRRQVLYNAAILIFITVLLIFFVRGICIIIINNYNNISLLFEFSVYTRCRMTLTFECLEPPNIIFCTFVNNKNNKKKKCYLLQKKCNSIRVMRDR